MTRAEVLWPDRHRAGVALAERLLSWKGVPRALVLGLPRGGVAVAAAVAETLQLPLATWAVRKLAHPAEPELAVGAMAPGDVLLWDEPDLPRLRLDAALRRQIVATQALELQRRQRLYGDPAPAALRGRPLLVVDDGVATGLTVRAALASLRQCDPARLVLAVPVIDRQVADRLRLLVDDLVTLAAVEQLTAVGAWYGRFDPVEDREVLALLGRGIRRR
jgi:putative phosphoribosyl transferase